jgi:hypothetical protein
VNASRGLVDTSLVLGGVPGIALEGDVLYVTLFPAVGGKILDLVHRPTGTNLLWQNSRVPFARTHAGAPFDDVWCGGWDELFPTDAACALGGNAFHDHGDLWNGPWAWSIDHDDDESAAITLRRHSTSLPCLVEKRIELRRESSSLVIRHRLTNLGPCQIPFVWSLHVAHSLEPGSRVLLPAGSVGAQEPYFGRAGPGTCSWPLHVDESGVEHDLSRTLAADSGVSEFLWARELREGWCAVVHPSAGIGLGLAFDLDVFPTVWLFADYGGWRGHHFLLTEPSTSPPGSLAENVAAGTAAKLDPRGMLETVVVATVLIGIHGDIQSDERPHGLVHCEELVG